MGDRRRAICKGCGKHRREVGELSWTGQCIACGRHEFVENIDHLVAHNGHYFDRWRRSMAACVGGVLVDDVLDETRQRA